MYTYIYIEIYMCVVRQGHHIEVVSGSTGESPCVGGWSLWDIFSCEEVIFFVLVSWSREAVC